MYKKSNDCEWKRFIMEMLLNDLMHWMNWFRNVTSRGKIFIIWMKSKALLKCFRESISLLINWNKCKRRLNLEDKSELLWWNIFISMNLRSHCWLYSKKKISIVDESLSIVVRIDITLAIPKIEWMIIMQWNDYKSILNLWHMKR